MSKTLIFILYLSWILEPHEPKYLGKSLGLMTYIEKNNGESLNISSCASQTGS